MKDASIIPFDEFDFNYLQSNVGFLTVERIANDLDRYPWQVQQLAEALWLDTALMCPELVWCNHCSMWRTKLDDEGKCDVCEKRSRFEAFKNKNAKLARLYGGNEEREERWCGSLKQIEPKPVYPDLKGEPDEKKRRLLEVAWFVAMENWETRQLLRKIEAMNSRNRRLLVKARALNGDETKLNGGKRKRKRKSGPN